MKLILTQEVTGLGGPGEVVEVKDGYGRNYLVPRGLAIAWTKGGEKQIATIKRAREVRDIADLGRADEVKSQLESLSVKLPVRAGEGGRLFGSVTVADIVAAVSRAGGPQIDKRRIELGAPIKTVGAHRVTVKLHSEVSATLALDVVAA
jgi:large subunit ribosomal protein L9